MADDTQAPASDTPISTGDDAWTKAGGLPQSSDAAASTDDDLTSLLDEEAQPGQTEGEETEEVDYEGKKYVIPKALKDGLLMKADYTRKTQSVAEERKGLEGEKAALQEARKAHSDFQMELGKLYSIDQKLQDFTKADWAKIEAEQGPAEAARQFREYNLLKDARLDVARSLQAKHEAQTLENQRNAAKKFEEGRATVAKEIPGWSNELAEKLNGYGTSNGFSLDELTAAIAEPRYVKALHKAYLYDQLVAKKAAAAKGEVIEAKPISQLGTRKTASTLKPSDASGDKLSTADWMAARNKELSGKAAARR